MADLLSSGALLVTMLSLFYTLWYPEVRETLDTLKPKDHPEDSVDDVGKITRVQRTRVIPLLVASLLMTVAFLPDAAHVVCTSIRAASSPNAKYDAVSALYLMMVLLTIALVVHIASLFFACRKLRQQLEHV